ncbi:MAG TPA: hypothetical protein VJ183_09035 [Chloroflexia bacterium]|nr:hypothetical protein [Chloroflexia bacterium]
MSTPPKRDAKAAAKRRAEARRRNREIARHLFAYGVIAILVIGTISTVLVPTVGAPTEPLPTAVPTQASNPGLDQLITQADQAVAASNWVSATTLYQAYLQLDGSRADVHLKLAKAITSSPSPDYLQAAQSLQQAISISGSGSAIANEAQQLLNTIQPQVSAASTAAALATPTSTVGITATATLTSTTIPLATSAITATASITSTVVEPVGPVLGRNTPVGTPAP